MTLFQNSLPISEYLEDIASQLQENRYLIVQADPGAGKSTAVPLFLLQNLDLNNQKIIMLEPRRLAARSIAEFLAQQLGEKVGQTVGYQVRNERKVSANTRLEIVTEGILSARIQQDPELHGIGLIIFDEFHERSIHADLGLALCKEVCEVYNEDLKLLIMSATLDSEVLSDYLRGAGVIHSEGRCYPVKTHFIKQSVDMNDFRVWSAQLVSLILQAIQSSGGDILVFLPGQGEIKRLQQLLEEKTDVNQIAIVPLFGGLKTELQQVALDVDEQGRKKVILATNIAETSLTIANISAVVDSGLERVMKYDVTSGMSRLVTQRISVASSEQRQGRAGRLQAGECYRLWTDTQQKNLEPYSAEQITQIDLADLRLAMAQWGVNDREGLAWITPPPKAHFDAATVLLQKLGLLSVEAKLTSKGEVSTSFGLEPRLSNMVVEAVGAAAILQSMVSDLVAILTDTHFYYDQDDADLVTRMMAIQAYRVHKKQALSEYPIKASICEQVLKTSLKLQRYFQLNTPLQHSLTDLQTHLGPLLSWSFPDRIAQKRKNNGPTENRYLLANGKGAVLPQQNRMPASPWLVVVDLDGQRKDGRIFLAVEVAEEDLANYPGFEKTIEYRYNEQKVSIDAVESLKLGSITVKQTAIKQPDKTEIKRYLTQIIAQTELKLLPWTEPITNWLARLRWLQNEASEQTIDWPDFSKKALIETMDEWLTPYLAGIENLNELKAIDLQGLLKARLDYQWQQDLEDQAPAFYQTPSGKRILISYEKGQLPKISVVLQELFGELQSPTLAWGKSRLSFELLSPAKRPIQTTSDLAHFWQNSYFEVAKEMRGRYPKHRWPDKPLLEKPGQSLKRKR